jgi:hypothetical protein
MVAGLTFRWVNKCSRKKRCNHGPGSGVFMVVGVKSLSGLRQELRQGGEVPISRLHIPVSEVSGQNEDPIDGPSPGVQPALQHPRGQGVSQVV